MFNWDDDIAHMDITDIEKNGVQMYRNYTKKFYQYRIEVFQRNMPIYDAELNRLDKICFSTCQEDIRIIPVTVCAYVDDMLLDMFKREIPEGVPGGKAALFGSYGPLSNLSGRIKMAHCFDLLGKDILKSIDLLRKVRNDISHSWDHENFIDYYSREPARSLFPIEENLKIRYGENSYKIDDLSQVEIFRIRVLWLLCRFTYECLYYPDAKKINNSPHEALYGNKEIPALTKASAIVSKYTDMIVLK